MSSLIVRAAGLADAGVLATIAAGTPNAPHWTAAQFREALSPRDPAQALRRAVLVAEAISEEACTAGVAGFVVVSAVCAGVPVEGELESIVVLPSLQGRGIGRMLLEAAMQWFATQGVVSVWLEVRAGNHRAREMYRRAGFADTGSRPDYYAGPTEDAAVMLHRITTP